MIVYTFILLKHIIPKFTNVLEMATADLNQKSSLRIQTVSVTSFQNSHTSSPCGIGKKLNHHLIFSSLILSSRLTLTIFCPRSDHLFLSWTQNQHYIFFIHSPSITNIEELIIQSGTP